MTRRQIILFLFLITLLSGLLRLYRLGSFPPALHRDEAFFGYNAYALAATGRDMSGNFLPLHLEWFLYSPAGYSYLAAVPVGIFGLNAATVRFPAAFFGAVTPLALFLLLYVLFKNHEKRTYIALIGALGLAISPWHINLSRTATENVPVVFFLCLGTFLYLSWCQRPKPYLVVLSFCSYLAAMFLYQAPRAYLPLFIPLLIALYRPKFTFSYRVPVLLYLVTILIPVAIIVLSPTLSLRLRTVGLFGSGEQKLAVDQAIREDGISHVTRIVTRAFHNKPIAYGSQFLQNYFSHFTYAYLFTDKGLPDRYRIPDMGLLYLYEGMVLLIGTYVLIRNWSSISALLFGWVLIAPIGSALAFDDIPNLQRTLIMLPAIMAISAVGTITLYEFVIRKIRSPRHAVFIMGMVITGFLIFYLHEYYIHEPLYRPWYRNDGYDTLVTSLQTLLPDYEKAVITDHESAPTIFFLFYTQFDPKKFQAITKANQASNHNTIGFEKFTFDQETCPLRDSIGADLVVRSTGVAHTLYVNFETCPIPNGAEVLREITRHDGSMVFRILRIPT